MATRIDHRESVSRLLMFVSGYVYRLLRYEARRKKMSWTSLMVLRDLDLLGPSDQRTLAAIEQVRAPTMTVLIRQMEDRGWVRRKRGVTDRRFNLVSITARGRRDLRSAGRILQQRLETEIAGVRPKALADLDRSLGDLSAVLMQKIKRSRG